MAWVVWYKYGKMNVTLKTKKQGENHVIKF